MSSSAAAWMSAAGTPSRTARSRSAVKGSWETKISDSMRFLRGLFMGTRPARILTEPDPYRLEELVLDGDGHPGLDQLEDAEKRDQGLLERSVGLEVLEKIDHVPLLKEPDELLHLDFDRDVPAANRPGVVGRPALHHEEKGFGQVEEGEFHRLRAL